MSWFYHILKRFFLNLKGLSEASVVSLTKAEYGSEVHFLFILMKSLELMNNLMQLNDWMMNDLMQFIEVFFCFDFSWQKCE